jgi:MFS family permease
VLITAQGIGAVAGGVVAAPLLKRTSEAILIVLGLCCAAGAVLLLTVPNLMADLAGVVLAGIVAPWIIVAATTALQRRTPSQLLGRVSGAFELSLTAPQVTSVGLGAALIAVVSYRVLLVAVAIVAAVAAAYLLAPRTAAARPHLPTKPLSRGIRRAVASANRAGGREDVPMTEDVPLPRTGRP